jgi:hypothetical protein
VIAEGLTTPEGTYAYQSGAGGSNNESGATTKVTIDIINYDGSVDKLTDKMFGGGRTADYPATASHQTNVSDPDICSECAKLYKLK